LPGIRFRRDDLCRLGGDDDHGAYFGSMIGNPAAIGIDVLLPIYFMGLSSAPPTANFLPGSPSRRRSIVATAWSARPGTSASAHSQAWCSPHCCRRKLLRRCRYGGAEAGE